MLVNGIHTDIFHTYRTLRYKGPFVHFLFVLVTESSRQMTDESEQGFMEVFKMERVSGSVLVACHLDSHRCRLFAILCGSVFMLGSIF